MASATCMPSVLLLLLLAAFAAGASAATFTIKNNCSKTVWPAGIPAGGGTQLTPGQTWTVDVPPGTRGRFWGRTGCTFHGGSGHCDTGDCAGQLSCKVPGDPPTTLAEYALNGSYDHDYYDISVISGYNLPMVFSCSTGGKIVCKSPECNITYQYPNGNNKTHSCNGNSNFMVTFCP